MNIDCHVHVCTFTPQHGGTSDHLLKSAAFRFMRWRLGLKGTDEATEDKLADLLARLIDETPALDAVVVLAFDAVYDNDGRLDRDNTHLYVTNDYAAALAQRNSKMLFGASVHPYRKDALAELERCVAAGAVLLKWLPIVQNFNPADDRCLPLYDAMAHWRLPLLCHTGGEKSLPNLDRSVADPALLEPALRRGVTVIGAHCGTKSAPWETDYLPTWSRMAREHEHFFGDTAALNLPTRSYAWRHLLSEERLRAKLVHGSDWPILPVPPLRVGLGAAVGLLAERNWLRRDVRIKQRLGLEQNYWERAAQIIRRPARIGLENNAAASVNEWRKTT